MLVNDYDYNKGYILVLHVFKPLDSRIGRYLDIAGVGFEDAIM